MKTASVLMFLFSLWLITENLEYFSPDVEAKLLFNTLQYFATAIIPVVWLNFCFMIRYDRSLFHTWPGKLSLVYPLSVITLVLTNSRHTLLWSRVYHDPALYGLSKDLEPLFDVFILLMLFTIVLGVIWLVYRPTEILKDRGNVKWFILGTGFLTVSIATLEWHMDYRHHFELTPLTLSFVALSGMLYIKNNIKSQVLLNSYSVLATLKEPLFLIDKEGIILFANDSAVKMSGISRRQFHSINIKILIPPLAHLNEGVIYYNHSFYTVNINTVGIDKHKPLTVSLTEVTALKDSEISLKHLSDELETQIKVRTERLNQSNQKLEKLVEEKNILLQEVHHRVNNNLQMIISLLNLQGSRTGDELVKNYLKEAVSRVQTIAMVHHMLYKSEDFSRINLKFYLEDLVKSMLKDNLKDLELDLSDIISSTNTCIQIGMIMNEIVLNAMKYAYSLDEEKKPFYCMSRVEKNKEKADRLHILFRDYGKGIDSTMEDAGQKSLGFKIINTLVQQRNGDLKIYNDKGCVYELWVEL